MKKEKLFRDPLSLVLLVSFVFFGSAFITPPTVSAQVLEGGRSQTTFFCNCNACTRIEVGSPKSGTFMYCPYLTRLYSHYNIYPNAWQLGKAYGYWPCLVRAGYYCVDDGGGPLLRMTGTSQGGF